MYNNKKYLQCFGKIEAKNGNFKFENQQPKMDEKY